MVEHKEYEAASARVSPTRAEVSYSKESLTHGRVPYFTEKSPTSDEYSSPENSPKEKNATPTSVQNVKEKRLVSGVNDKGTKSCLEQVEPTISHGKSTQFKLKLVDDLSKPTYKLQSQKFLRQQLINTNWKKNILVRHTTDLTRDRTSVKLQQNVVNSFVTASSMNTSVGSSAVRTGFGSPTKKRRNEQTPLTPSPTHYPPRSDTSCVHCTTSVNDFTEHIKFQDAHVADVHTPQLPVPLPEMTPALPVSSGPQPKPIPSLFKCPSSKFLKSSSPVRSDTVQFPCVRSTRKKVTSD